MGLWKMDSGLGLRPPRNDEKIVLAMRPRIRALRTTTRTKKACLPEGRRSADRRIQPWPHHASECRHSQALQARRRPVSRAARLSALRRGTRQGERIRRWLSSSSCVSWDLI